MPATNTDSVHYTRSYGSWSTWLRSFLKSHPESVTNHDPHHDTFIVSETKPGDLIGILLPTSSMFPLAMLACLAAGRPFVALDPRYPGNWLGQVLEDARPALIIGREDVLVVSA